MDHTSISELLAPDIYTGKSAAFKFKRKRSRQRLAEVDTTSQASNSTDEVGSTSSDSSFSSLDAADATTSKGWKRLRWHLEKGTLLLTANGLGSEYACSQQHKFLARQAIVQEFQKGNFSIRFCLMAIGIYLCISIAMYSCVLEPTWTVIDSCYFAVTTFTTLGYGDLSPTNTSSVIFTCVYAVLGVAFLGMFLGALGNQLIERHDGLIKEVEANNQEEVMTLFGTMPDERQRDFSKSTARRWWKSLNSFSERGNWLGNLGTKLCGGGTWNWQRFVWLCTLTLILTSVISYRSGWDVISTIYFIIVTSCTIGYGDLTPTTQMQRLIAVFYIPLVCLIMGHWLGYVANAIIELCSSKVRKNRLENRELTQDDLDAMDANGDGKVTYAEFLEFMLVAMNKIDYDLVDELQSAFRRLDINHTGQLSRGDLVELARRKLRTARRKLELAAYKRRVLNLGKFSSWPKTHLERKTVSGLFLSMRDIGNKDSQHAGHGRSGDIFQSMRRPQHRSSMTDIMQSSLRNLSLFDLKGEKDNHEASGERLPLIIEGAAQLQGAVTAPISCGNDTENDIERPVSVVNGDRRTDSMGSQSSRNLGHRRNLSVGSQSSKDKDRRKSNSIVSSSSQRKERYNMNSDTGGIFQMPFKSVFGSCDSQDESYDLHHPLTGRLAPGGRPPMSQSVRPTRSSIAPRPRKGHSRRHSHGEVLDEEDGFKKEVSFHLRHSTEGQAAPRTSSQSIQARAAFNRASMMQTRWQFQSPSLRVPSSTSWRTAPGSSGRSSSQEEDHPNPAASTEDYAHRRARRQRGQEEHPFAGRRISDPSDSRPLPFITPG